MCAITLVTFLSLFLFLNVKMDTESIRMWCRSSLCFHSLWILNIQMDCSCVFGVKEYWYRNLNCIPNQWSYHVINYWSVYCCVTYMKLSLYVAIRGNIETIWIPVWLKHKQYIWQVNSYCSVAEAFTVHFRVRNCSD